MSEIFDDNIREVTRAKRGYAADPTYVNRLWVEQAREDLPHSTITPMSGDVVAHRIVPDDEMWVPNPITGQPREVSGDDAPEGRHAAPEPPRPAYEITSAEYLRLTGLTAVGAVIGYTREPDDDSLRFRPFVPTTDADGNPTLRDQHHVPELGDRPLELRVPPEAAVDGGFRIIPGDQVPRIVGSGEPLFDPTNYDNRL